jgi:hypothetical protein
MMNVQNIFFLGNLETLVQSLYNPETNGILLSNDKYTFITSGSTLIVPDELIKENTGTYQISFQNVFSFNLKDIDVGVLHVTHEK